MLRKIIGNDEFIKWWEYWMSRIEQSRAWNQHIEPRKDTHHEQEDRAED